MGKITKSELDRIKTLMPTKIDPAGNKQQISDIEAVRLYGLKNAYVIRYITRKQS